MSTHSIFKRAEINTFKQTYFPQLTDNDWDQKLSYVGLNVINRNLEVSQALPLIRAKFKTERSNKILTELFHLLSSSQKLEEAEIEKVKPFFPGLPILYIEKLYPLWKRVHDHSSGTHLIQWLSKECIQPMRNPATHERYRATGSNPEKFEPICELLDVLGNFHGELTPCFEKIKSCSSENEAEFAKLQTEKDDLIKKYLDQFLALLIRYRENFDQRNGVDNKASRVHQSPRTRGGFFPEPAAKDETNDDVPDWDSDFEP